ncbi:MAG TPA: hypothetical protein VEU33_27590 [Archangium sp.]|nr:hypothetical protein [Archangium sp.]
MNVLVLTACPSGVATTFLAARVSSVPPNGAVGNMNSGNTILLGAMMCFDLGGPINKAAYTFGVGLLSRPSAWAWRASWPGTWPRTGDCSCC